MQWRKFGMLITLPFYSIFMSCGNHKVPDFVTAEPAPLLVSSSALNDSPSAPLFLTVAEDSALFAANDTSADSVTGRPIVSSSLQKEIKYQFLQVLSRSQGIFSEVASGGALHWKELNITRVDHTTLKVDLGIALGSEGSADAQPISRVASNAIFEVENSRYNVNFVFEDLSSAQVYRVFLNEPLNVQENIKVLAKSEIVPSALLGLKPTWLASAVAVFLKDMNLAIKASGSWERSSQVTASMYYYGRGNFGYTELMASLASQIVPELCGLAYTSRGMDSSKCLVPNIKPANALSELKSSLRRYKVLRAVKCSPVKFAGVVTGFLLHAPSDGIANPLQEGQRVTVYRQSGEQSPWRKVAWARVTDRYSASNCIDSRRSLECVQIHMGTDFAGRTCEDMANGKASYGFSIYPQL